MTGILDIIKDSRKKKKQSREEKARQKALNATRRKQGKKSIAEKINFGGKYR